MFTKNMSKSSYKKIMNESVVSMGKVYSNPYANSFKSTKQINEDGHTDVPSAIRKLKTSIEDCQDILQKLESLGDKPLPSWWTDKITLSANYLNKARDYLLNTNESLDTPAKYSNPEAKLHIDADITQMSKHLGKASQQVIKIMMDGVKGGRYDALDIQRGIEFGPFNRTHEGERPFMKMLWNKVRKGFRRYMPKGKLRK
jgi:hypothetical protein